MMQAMKEDNAEFWLKMNFEFLGTIWCVYEAVVNLLVIFYGSREVIIQLDSDKAAVNM